MGLARQRARSAILRGAGLATRWGRADPDGAHGLAFARGAISVAADRLAAAHVEVRNGAAGLSAVGVAHAGEGGAVHVVGAQYHRDALVGLGDPIVLVPVRAAPPRGGAEDVSTRPAQRLRVRVAGADQL